LIARRLIRALGRASGGRNTQQMNTLIERIYQTGRVEDPDRGLVTPFPTSVPYETGALLYDVVFREGLDSTLEVGMAYGLSTLFICQAHRDKGSGRHTAIDPQQGSRFRAIGLANVRKAGLDGHLSFHEAPSFEVLPVLCRAGEVFDFAFIDGQHLFDYVLVDFFYIDKLLRVGGYVVFDDLWLPQVRKVVSFVLRNRGYQLIKVGGSRRSPPWRRAAQAARRFAQTPLTRDVAVKLIGENVCVLKKVNEDERSGMSHRPF
jgi:predicted O-methyltransferase YrrM